MENNNQSVNTLRWIQSRIESSISVKQALVDRPILEQISQVGEVLVQLFQSGGQVLLFGNGGSAADAQHIATELVSSFYIQRKALSALALTTNTSTLTAIGNDKSIDEVFLRQIEAHGKPGDVAIGISTSGRSRDIIQGLIRGRELGLYTVALTGAHGSEMQPVSDICISVPSEDTPRIQESHILIGHILCEYVEAKLFGNLYLPGKGE